MAQQRLVAVSYPADGEITAIINDVLRDTADVRVLDGLDKSGRRAALGESDALISLHLAGEVPGGALAQAPRLGLIQMLSAGLDGLDFSMPSRRRCWSPGTSAPTRSRSPSTCWP